MDYKMDAKCCCYRRIIKPSSKKIYGLVKTHKGNKPLRVITSDCGAGVENLSIIVGKYFFAGVLKLKVEFKIHLKFLTIYS